MFDFLKQKDRTPPVLPEGTVRRHFSISGQVQGVGFRYRARYAAQALDLTDPTAALTQAASTLDLPLPSDGATLADMLAGWTAEWAARWRS